MKILLIKACRDLFSYEPFRTEILEEFSSMERCQSRIYDYREWFKGNHASKCSFLVLDVNEETQAAAIELNETLQRDLKKLTIVNPLEEAIRKKAATKVNDVHSVFDELFPTQA